MITNQFNNSKALLLGVLAVLTLSLTGCATQTIGLKGKGDAADGCLPAQIACVDGIEVRLNQETPRITGWVSRHVTGTTADGHVDYAIVSPDGAILESGSVRYSPRILHRDRLSRGWAVFHADLAQSPPEGSTVYAAFHGSVLEDNSGCTANKAANPTKGEDAS